MSVFVCGVGGIDRHMICVDVGVVRFVTSVIWEKVTCHSVAHKCTQPRVYPGLPTPFDQFSPIFNMVGYSFKAPCRLRGCRVEFRIFRVCKIACCCHHNL